VAPPVAFIIEWDDPDEERLAVEGVGAHENGTASAMGVSVVRRTRPAGGDEPLLHSL